MNFTKKQTLNVTEVGSNFEKWIKATCQEDVLNLFTVIQSFSLSYVEFTLSSFPSDFSRKAMQKIIYKRQIKRRLLQVFLIQCKQMSWSAFHNPVLIN